MDYLPQFKLWLKAKSYSDSTARNYLADLGKYLNYINRLPQKVSLDIPTGPEHVEGHIFSPDILGLYVSYLSDKNNAGRYLASLNQFCQFALDQHLVSQNPLKSILKQQHSSPNLASDSNLKHLVDLYEQHLTKHKTAPVTIKNYLNDLHQYISWLETTPNPPAFQASPFDKGDSKSKQKLNFFTNFFSLVKGRSPDERREEGL